MYLVTDSVDPAYNLAFEEYVLREKKQEDWLMLWSNDRSVILGQNQLAAQEVDLAYARKLGIKIVRRMSGGGAVYHDTGNLNYSFITDTGNVGQISMTGFVEAIVSALRGLGLRAEASGRNDILVNGCKVSGTADRLCGKRILHHGTLLFDSNLETAAAVLKPRPGKFESKASKSVRARICNIKDCLAEDMTMSEFRDYMARQLCRDPAPRRLTNNELDAVRRLADEKYRTDEWNFGYEASFDYENSARFPGGTLEVRLTVEDDVIADISFYGDFLSRISQDEVIAALRGCPYRREDVLRRLEGALVYDSFGHITAKEIVSIIV